MKYLFQLILLFFLQWNINLFSRPVSSCFSFKNEIKFILLTDLHVSPGASSNSALNRIVDEINTTAADFVIVTGDLSNTGSDAELNSVKNALDRLNKKCHVIPGNHETNWAESAGLTLRKLWGDDRFLFHSNGFCFAGFNTGPYMKMGDGHVKQEDVLWLKDQVKSIPAGEIFMAFCHYPLAEGLDDWTQVTEVLKSAGCRAVFCGHGHSLKLYNFNGIPGIMGRSVILGKSRVPGYNIIYLRNDSIIVINKPLNSLAEKPAIGISYTSPDTLATLAISPLPSFEINKDYKNRKIVAEWADSSSIFSGPCIVYDSILIYGNSSGYIKALSTRSKSNLWQIRIDGPVYSTPAAWKGIVALGTIDGRIIGLDALTGKLLWEVETGRPVLAEGAAEDGFLYIGGGDRVFYKIDMRNGKTKWSYPGVLGLMQGKAVLSASSVVFGAWDRHLYCLDKNTGSLIWKWNNGKPQPLYSPGNIFPACSEGKVFIVAPDRFMTALDLNTGKQIWRINRHHVRESMGMSPDGTMIYAKLMNDTVIAVSAKENSAITIRKINAGFGYEHNPCPVTAFDNEVLTGTREGVVISLDPDRQEVNWRYKAGTSSVNKVVADNNGTFWLTLMEGRIMGIRTEH